MKMQQFRLKDVILMAILAVIFAVIYLAIFYGGLALQTVLAPAGLAPFGFEIIYGVWFMAATIAAYIIRKPGVALLTEVLTAVLELMMGNSGGVVLIITGIIQGLGCELGFALFRYRRYNLLTMSLAGLLAASFIFVFELFYLQYYLLSPLLLAAQLGVRFISSFIFTGLISKLASDGLARTGVLKNYPIGKVQANPEVLKD